MGRRGSKRRGRRETWDNTAPTWKAVMRATVLDQSAAGGEHASSAAHGLRSWLGGVAGSATLMSLTLEQFREQETMAMRALASATEVLVAGVSAERTHDDSASLRQATSCSEMLAAVGLCKRAFSRAQIKMGKDFWLYDSDERPSDPKDMPYEAAVPFHAKHLASGEEPTRRYYLYTDTTEQPNSTGPTAAVVVDVLVPGYLWVIQLMGSCQPGHGRKAVEELKRQAFEGTAPACRTLVLEAVAGATHKHQKLPGFYARCGFQNCGNTPKCCTTSTSEPDAAALGTAATAAIPAQQLASK